jgi:hypothetical protein
MSKQNEERDKDREAVRLGRPDELPPEEFIGLEETGEFPEWQPDQGGTRN